MPHTPWQRKTYFHTKSFHFIVEKKDVGKPPFYKKSIGKKIKIIVFQQLFFCKI
jgi:hypothetical protein